MAVKKEHLNEILSADCVQFLNYLHSNFEEIRTFLLSQRGKPVLDFLPHTKKVREEEWQCAAVPKDLKTRKVEITGPPVRKMVINALNSGADVYMSDFEDSCSPTWSNIIEGQKNLKDAVSRTISVETESKTYKLNRKTAVLFVRPRGLHMTEKHFFNMSASLFDFGVFLFHNLQTLLDKKKQPYFYLPKLENYTEAAWWAKVFDASEKYFNVSKGTIRCTVLIETLPAVFQMNEILYSLKDYITGLNCGRWDYIFSYIKNNQNKTLPDRSALHMGQNFLNAYSRTLVETCHRRGVHAMGGMAAQIPVKDEIENQKAIEKVTLDKVREINNGHDGTWVAHPGLVNLVKDIFKNTKPKDLPPFVISKNALLEHPTGVISLDGLRKNLKVSVQYLASWLSGNGCVPIDNLMEDAATAEISRTQVWQWIQSKRFLLSDVKEILEEETKKLEETKQFDFSILWQANTLLESILEKKECVPFLTNYAYDFLLINEKEYGF